MGRPTSFVQYIREEYCAVCNEIIFRRQITHVPFVLSLNVTVISQKAYVHREIQCQLACSGTR